MEIKRYKKVFSTNLLAKKARFAPWTVVLAETQIKGYGKEKRIWFSPKGGLYFSVILPKNRLEDLQTLTILSAFVVAKVLKENFSLEPLIKLPNDVLINDKKICGILTENMVKRRKAEISVVGIGLNTNIEKFPKELEKSATSLQREVGKKVKNKIILKQIAEGIKEQLGIINR